MESRDFEALKEIYNQVIDERVATFNTEHVDVDGIRLDQIGTHSRG